MTTRPLITAILALAVTLPATLSAQETALELGDTAPAFALPGSDGQVHRLADYLGHMVVLAWFPKAFTGG